MTDSVERKKYLLAFFATILLLLILCVPTIQSVKEYWFGDDGVQVVTETNDYGD